MRFLAQSFQTKSRRRFKQNNQDEHNDVLPKELLGVEDTFLEKSSVYHMLFLKWGRKRDRDGYGGIL